MPCFVFFTKTLWDEPPRLRHQLAELLSRADYEVIFFQKPRYFWQPKASSAPPERSIVLDQHSELVHHKLRLAPFLHEMNSRWVQRDLRHAVRDHGISGNDVIVNFNYEYYFLRSVFPENRILTIINDDHIANAPFGYVAPLAHALRRTCEASDEVLVVSYPLERRLSGYCSPKLFLPWADRDYSKPVPSRTRDTLLYWGYINSRIDIRFVLQLAENLEERSLRLLFVGPAQDRALALKLRSHPNIEVEPATELDRLPRERIFGGLIPYRSNDPRIAAVSLSNKALQLLARGLPLLVTGMPEFISAPFVFPMNAPDARQVEAVRVRFDELQASIAQFVSQNTGRARLEQLMGMVAR